jgi:hypothetical protein
MSPHLSLPDGYQPSTTSQSWFPRSRFRDRGDDLLHLEAWHQNCSRVAPIRKWNWPAPPSSMQPVPLLQGNWEVGLIEPTD